MLRAMRTDKSPLLSCFRCQPPAFWLPLGFRRFILALKGGDDDEKKTQVPALPPVVPATSAYGPPPEVLFRTTLPDCQAHKVPGEMASS